MTGLSFSPDELIVDNFAGGGGASLGIEMALGRSPDIAINHDDKALAMHAINHTHTLHVCEDVWKADIVGLVAGRPVGLAWFSPDCKHFSKAKGGKPVEKKIRGLAWVALRWAGLVRPRVIFLENVEEFQDWGPVLADGKPCARRKGMTFKRWCTQLRNLGYALEWREERACWHGSPTIRKRLVVIARRDGQPIVWPERTHGKGKLPYRTAVECIDWSIPCPSIFLSREEGRAAGCNRPLAEATLERIAKGVWKYVINAAEPFIVNITHQGGDRSEPLAEPLRTITAAKRGEKVLVTPYLATYYGSNRPGGERTAPLQEPLRTQSTENRFGLIAPILVHNNTNNVASSPADPLKTVTTGNRHFEVAAFLSRQFGNSVGSPANEPGPTTTAGGGGKTALTMAHLAQHNSGMVGHDARKPLSTVTGRGTQQQVVATHVMKIRGTNIGHGADEPLHTASAQGNHFAQVNARLVHAAAGDWPPSAYKVAAFLLKYYGTDQDPRLDEPLHSATTKDRFAVVMVTIRGEDYVIVDIGMRMLAPRELFRAQGFPDSYIIDRGIRIARRGDTKDLFSAEIHLTRTEQIRMCGNSVCPQVAAAVVAAQFGGHQAKKGAAA